MTNRRNFLVTSGAAGVGLVLAGCGATTQTVDTILTDIDNVAGDAISVLNSVEGVLGGIAQPIFAQVDGYLVAVQSACEQALSIGKSGQTLTLAQVEQIIVLFANLAVASIPGVPDVVKLAIVAVEAAITTLLNFLKPQVAAAQANGIFPVKLSLGRYTGPFSHYSRVSGHVKKIGTTLETVRAKYATTPHAMADLQHLLKHGWSYGSVHFSATPYRLS